MPHSNPHTAGAAAPDATRASAHAREGAFTLVEILIVVVIAAVIIGFALSSLRSTKAQSQTNKARSTAIQLGEAIQQFQRDHGGRPPGQPGSAQGRTDWDTRYTSPIDRANQNKAYAKGTSVEALAAGEVTLENNRGQAFGTRPSRIARIRYLDDQNRGIYVLVAYVNKSSGLQPQCYVSNSSMSSISGMLRPIGVQRAC